MAQDPVTNDLEIYVAVAEDKNSDEAIHIPCNDDGTLPLSAVDIYYPDVVGLNYRMETCTRAIKLRNGNFHPPKDGWGVDTTYYCVFRKASTKRKAIDSANISESKHPKSTDGDQQLNEKDDSDFVLAKTIFLTGKLKNEFFSNLSLSGAAYRSSVNEIDFFVDGRFIRVTVYDTKEDAGDTPKKLCYKNNFALITYEANCEKSLFAAKETANTIKEVCPGCILLVRMFGDVESSSAVSLQRLIDMREFTKFDSSHSIDILETFKLLIKLSQHIALENWTILNCFIERPRIFDYSNGKLRAYVQNLFTKSTDPIILINQIIEDMKVYSQWHCLRLSSIPVVDILRCLLKTKQKSAFGHTFIDVVVDKSKIIYQPMNDFPTRIPCFIIEFAKSENYRPIVFTTKVRYQGDEAQFLVNLPAITDEEYGLDLETNDSYEIERTAMYKLSSLGYPWRLVHSMTPDPLEQILPNSLFRVPEAPRKENENSAASVTHADISLNSSMDIAETNVNNSSQASDDAASSVQNSNPAREQVENNQSTSMVNSGLESKPKSGRKNNRNTKSQSRPGSNSNQTSRCSQTSKSNLTSQSSQNSIGNKKACEQALVTTVKTKHGVTKIKGDRLVLDVIIYCSTIELCRYLSAVFNLVHLDEILLNFVNLKAENVSKSKIITFKDEGIAGILLDKWDEILDCQDGFHKTIRTIQTRFSECLNSGRHNIGVTCCEEVLINAYSNARAMIRLPDEDMRLHLYSIVITLPDKYNFIDSIAALTKIIDLVFQYPASVTLPLYFNGQYYTVPISLISVIPFYILRSYYHSIVNEDIGKILVERAKKLSLI